ncbi:MAG TPA: hypothetical protein VN721_13880 [Flavipsychrobacter sp.]|nr:hypothetical protein [Flavipsychrobacter sp.]
MSVQVRNREGKVIIIDNRNNSLAVILGFAFISSLIFMAWYKKHQAKLKIEKRRAE